MQDSTRVKELLEICFQGDAALWWNNKLDTVWQAGYLAMPGVEDICKALESQFPPPPAWAISMFNTTQYSVKDCCSQRSIMEYLATLEAVAQHCGFGPTKDNTRKYGLVIQAWMHLDLPLQETVDEPEQGMTLEQFTKILLQKQNDWFNQYHPHSCQPQHSYKTKQYLQPQSQRPYLLYQLRQYSSSYQPVYSKQGAPYQHRPLQYQSKVDLSQLNQGQH